MTETRLTITLFLLILLTVTAATPASAVTEEEQTELSKYEIPSDALPDGWSTASTQFGEESNQPRFYQTLENPDSRADLDYVVAYDPHKDLHDDLTDEVAYEGSGDTETTYFDSTEVEIAPDTGDPLTATLNRVKEDDPNYDQDFVKLIRITAHHDGFTHVVEADSWVLLRDAGDPDTLVTETLTAGVSRATSADVDRATFGPVPTETATPETTYTPPSEVSAGETDTETEESGGEPTGGGSGDEPRGAPGFGAIAALTGAVAALLARERLG